MIKLVLDTSAIRAYLAGNINVGEPIGEITDEGHQFGLPVACLAEASAQSPGHPLLDVLVQHPSAVVLPLTGNWRALSFGVTVTGGLGPASAWIEATEHHGYVLTADPHVYGGPGASGIIAVD